VGKSKAIEEQDRQRAHAQIAKLCQEHEGKIDESPLRRKLLVSTNHEKADEVITNNKLLEYLSKDEECEIILKLKNILSCEGPLQPGIGDYKGYP
jgi:hypothetical protein